MTQNSSVIVSHPSNDFWSGWLRAYVRFLLSKDESLVLKAAPLALIGVLPIDIVSNIIPGIGLLDDAGYLIIFVAVIYKTLSRVNYHRRRHNILSTEATV